MARFALQNDDSLTIDRLTVGETYTVTEENGWTWHYNPLDPVEVTIRADKGNEVEFENNAKPDKWLYAESSKHNVFGTVTGGEQ